MSFTVRTGIPERHTRKVHKGASPNKIMKIKNFQENSRGVEIPNLLIRLRNKNIYIVGCSNILRNHITEIRKLAKRKMIYKYVNGKSAVPVDLIIRLSENNPEILEECFSEVKAFASKSNKGHVLPKKITPDLAYLVGCLRDGSINKNTISITQNANGKQWLNIISKIFHEEFNLKPRMRKFRDFFEIRVTSKPLVIFFKEIFEMPTNQENWSTPKIIEENKQLWKYYISGFFDAEGYCTKPETFRKTGKKKISFHQNNLNSLEFIKKVLNELGIRASKIYLQKDRKCYALYIQSKSGILIFNENFNPIRKEKELKRIIYSISL